MHGIWKQDAEALRRNQEQRRSSAASKHVNRKRYTRKRKHTNKDW
jgi:hypothetical protein